MKIIKKLLCVLFSIALIIPCPSFATDDTEINTASGDSIILQDEAAEEESEPVLPKVVSESTNTNTSSSSSAKKTYHFTAKAYKRNGAKGITIKITGVTKAWSSNIKRPIRKSGYAKRSLLKNTTNAAKLVYYYGYKLKYGTNTYNGIKLSRALSYNASPKYCKLTQKQKKTAKAMIATAKKWSIPKVLNFKVYKYTSTKKYKGKKSAFIGYTTSKRSVNIGYTYENSKISSAIKNSYAKAVNLPLVITEEDAASNLDNSNIVALIIPGGESVNPSLYNHESVYPHILNDERDLSEMCYLKVAFERDLPVMCICRGSQLLNVVNGGTLCQDIPTYIEQSIEHKGVYHEISITGGVLKEVFGSSCKPYSNHHQCVDELGDNMIVTAKSSDGVIEGTQMTNKTYVIGVQFHPEKQIKEALYTKLFDRLVDEAIKYDYNN